MVSAQRKGGNDFEDRAGDSRGMWGGGKERTPPMPAKSGGFPYT